MKKILKSVLLVILILGITGCTGNLEVSGEISNKPSVASECDWFGFDSKNIIKNKDKQGYRFTGRTKGMWCENLLMFELKENE